MKKKLIIDSNLFLLLVIGGVEGGKYIQKSKRLNAYTYTDYEQILNIISSFDDIYITPYIAAEVSNLIDLYGHARIIAYQIARQLYSLFKQVNTHIADDSQSNYFIQYGIADASLIGLAKNHYILTNDFRLLKPLFQSNPGSIIPYSRN